MAKKKGKSEGQLIAIARDKYFKNNRILLGTPSGQYLKNRLELAFIAGCNEKSHRPVEAELLVALKRISDIENDWDGAIPECDVCCKIKEIAEQAIAKAKE